jgi:hypothetical protein
MPHGLGSNTTSVGKEETKNMREVYGSHLDKAGDSASSLEACLEACFVATFASLSIGHTKDP